MANPSVEEKIKAAAAAKGIPADLAMRMASAESRYSPNAQNPRSTAGGVFQIIDDTWKRYGGAPGKRFDVDENIRVGTNIIADNQVNMKRLLNRQPTYGEVYAAHYFGPDKAKAVINAAPNTLSNTIFSAKVLKANPNLKDKTTAEIMAMLDRKMSPTGRSAPPAPRGPAASEFAAPGRADPLLLTQNTQRTQNLPDVSRETMLAALGPNYQAAMALSYLSGNTDEDDSDLEAAKDRIAADKESARSPGMEFLMEERRPSPFASLDLTASTPFAEPVARMKKGGEVDKDKGDEDKGDEDKSFFEEKSAKQRLDEMQNPPDKGPYVGSELMPSPSRLQLQGEIANDTYGGVGGFGRATYTRPISSEAALRAYIEGGGYKPKDRDYKGQVNNMGVSYNIGFNDGGVVHRADGTPPEGEKPQVDNTASAKATAMLRGFGDSAYSLAGGPVDLATMAMRLAGYKAEKPILGSEWIKQKAEEYGIRPANETDPQLNRLRQGSEFVSSFINPSVPILAATSAGREAMSAGRQALTAGKAAANAAISATGEKMGNAVLNKMDKIIEAKRQRLIEKAATRPLTPRETRSLRLIEADMQPDEIQRGMFTVGGNQGMLDQVIADQNIARVHGPAAPAVPEIAPVAPPVDVRVPAAAPEALPPPPAEVNIPAEMPAPANQAPQGWGVVNTSVAPPDLVSVGQPANAPFVGRLDTFVQSLKGPVTLGQLKGQLKGKFRDYDLARVDEAFKGMDPNTKLKPAQIVSALENTYSPSKWVSETLPPEKGKYWSGQDTVWDQPLGTTNLYLAQTPEKVAVHNEVAKVIEGITPFATSSYKMPTIANIEETKALLNLDLVKNIVDPALANELLTKLNKVEPRVQELNKNNNFAENLKYGVLFPVLYKDPAVTRALIESLPPQYAYIAKVGDETISPHFVFEQLRYAELSNQTPKLDFQQNYNQAKKYAVEKVHELVANKAEETGLPRPDFSAIDYDDLSNLHKQPAAKAFVDTYIEPIQTQIRLDLNAVKKYTGDTVKKVAADLEKARLYEGKHKSVAGEPYPIGFTRFSEHEANIGGQTMQGRHFHEIQSDLSNAVKNQGSSKGSKAADQAEYDALNTQKNQVTNSMMEEKLLAQATGVDPTAYQKRMDNLEKSLNTIEGRIKILGNRMRSSEASYSLQEPFAGFETNSNVRSQLLMKNAIYSAMKDGKSFATFPGAESAKPQLYEGKVMPNLKQIAKDLGGDKAGISVTPIQLPPATKGNAPGVPVTAWGITWSPEAAARITKTGMPFAKGGMVERQPDDNRRYL